MKLTKRGRQVRAVLILAGVVCIAWISSRVWFDGEGWCIGSMAQCVGI